MAEQENLRLIRDAYAAFARGDIQTILDSLTDDVEWETPGPSQIPYTGVFRGKEGVAQFFTLMIENDEMDPFEPQRFFADGDMVVVLGRYAARVRATGNRAESDLVHAFTLRGGKVAKYRVYYDTAKAAKAYEPASTLT